MMSFSGLPTGPASQGGAVTRPPRVVKTKRHSRPRSTLLAARITFLSLALASPNSDPDFSAFHPPERHKLRPSPSGTHHAYGLVNDPSRVTHPGRGSIPRPARCTAPNGADDDKLSEGDTPMIRQAFSYSGLLLLAGAAALATPSLGQAQHGGGG